MALDSRNRRASALGIGLAFLALAPQADGSLAPLADRQQAAYLYAGIEANPAPRVEQIFVLAAHPYDPTVESTLDGPPWPHAEIDDTSLLGGEGAVYWSGAPGGYTTHASDTPRLRYFEPRLLTTISFEVSLFNGAEPGARTTYGFGNIEVANGDGALDGLAHLGWDGREIAIWRGEPGAAFASFTRVFRGTADGIEWNESRLTIRLRDRQALFDRPLQQDVYAGTGGYEGGEDLGGKRRPCGFGQCFNTAPTLIDDTWLVYQFHSRTAESVDSVRDKGIPLDFCGTDAATWAELVALSTGAEGSGADIEPGEYATCLALGLIRLGASPAGLVTADVKGDAVGGYVATTGAIVRRLVTGWSQPVNLADPGDLDTAAFAVLESAQPATVGRWLGPDDEHTVAETIDELMAGIGGYWNITLDGRFSLAVLAAPDDSGQTLTVAQIGAGTPLDREHRAVPFWRRRVGYKQSNTVQGPDALASSIADSFRALYGQEYRYAEAADRHVRTRHKLSETLTTAGFFVQEAAAKSLADRLLALHGSERDFYRLRIETDDPLAAAFDLGRSIGLDVARFDLDGGKRFRIVGAAIEISPARAEIVLTLWG